jgi:hypothetical protein
MNMHGDRHESPQGAGLETCVECGRAFVVPVALLELVDEGLYLLALHCKNCDRLAVGIHEDAELEQLELHNETAAAELESGAELLKVSRFIDDLAGFDRALDEDLVLPEDF